MSQPFFIPRHEIRREMVVVNSRFIATLSPVFSSEDAKAFFNRIRAEFSEATHNVPAYILGGGNSVSEYCSDDGEPSGTAGRPALAVLRGSGLGNVAVVVTRYFGGTLLGKGGLVKAYTEAVQMTVADVPRARILPVHITMFDLPYALLEQIRRLSTKFGGHILAEEFAAQVTMTVQFPVQEFAEFQMALKEISSGQIIAEILETKEMLVPVG